jgi:gamma-glutamyl-gamma-aminobutyrate hydrolase PuuD
MCANICTVDVRDAPADGGAVGEIKLVRGAVDGVVLDGGRDIEPGLLEAKTHPARSREQIDAEWSFSVAVHLKENVTE